MNASLFSTCASRRNSIFFVLFGPLVLLCADTGLEVEPNNDFGSAQVVDPGVLSIAGDLAVFLPISPFIARSGTLETGVVDSFMLPVVAGAPYTAIIDNTDGGADTTMRALDEMLNPIIVDDDSSPLGTGVGSALMLNGNPDGMLHLQISGYDDFDFDGLSDSGGTPHTESGDYSLFVYQGMVGGDIDLYTFGGLTVGQMYIAETLASDTGFIPDTILGVYDDVGALLQTDDDGGEGVLSQLVLTVPSSGTLHIGVSGFADFGLVGSHSQSGSYTLELRAVPEPTGASSGIFVVLAAVAFIRRRRT